MIQFLVYTLRSGDRGATGQPVQLCQGANTKQKLRHNFHKGEESSVSSLEKIKNLEQNEENN